MNPGWYEQILEENKGRTNTSTEVIEKDLHRSLPEYLAYQSDEGIGAFQRVLQAFSFNNPETKCCQVGRCVCVPERTPNRKSVLGDEHTGSCYSNVGLAPHVSTCFLTRLQLHVRRPGILAWLLQVG